MLILGSEFLKTLKNLLGTSGGGDGDGVTVAVPLDGWALATASSVLVTGGGGDHLAGRAALGGGGSVSGVVNNHRREGGHGRSFTLLHCAQGIWDSGVLLKVLLL